ncbi:MAG: polymer-forming cytoskeletal protein [Anaerolineae bacterium]
MAFFRSGDPRPATDKIENVIGPSADFSGELKADGGIRIDGVFEGAVESQSNVIVGEGARVVADVSAFNITVAGSVKGNVKAVGRLEILSTGRVLGDVLVGSLLIEEGGVFHGQSLMDEDEPSASSDKRRPSGAAIQSSKQQQDPPDDSDNSSQEAATPDT